ncbi:hypothetical protein [Streptomyces sp. NPDC001508]|uniref:hypothetical protein n=1 Tax=Streptomyces sp. NPDC001508 TaxID=3154656 RepID=UPI00332F2FD4
MTVSAIYAITGDPRHRGPTRSADGGGVVALGAAGWVGGVGCRAVAVGLGAGGRVAVGRVVVGVSVGDGRVGVEVGVAGVVPDVSGWGVRDGGVGRGGFPEGDGVGRGVPPCGPVRNHTPMPPQTTTAAPAAIHGAFRGGRR